MHRPRPTFWIATATVAALALGGGVAAAARDGSASTTHVEDRAHPEDTASTSTSTTSVVPVVPSPPAAVPAPGDDPATHDVGDDHGVDNPATHDVGDDHGADNSGPNRGPGTGVTTDDSGHDDSGHSGSGHDDSGHGGPGRG